MNISIIVPQKHKTLTICQEKDTFVMWRTKGGRPIPIFGKGTPGWTQKQRTPFNKKKAKKKASTEGEPSKRAFRTLSTQEVDTWGEKNYGKWFDSLDDGEIRFLRLHKTKSSSINAHLRRGGEGTSHEKNYVKQVDSALKKSTVPEDIVVFRGMLKPDEYPSDPKKLIGTTITDKAFLSTSVSAKTADIFVQPGGYKLNIKVPKGSKGAYIELASDFEEQELLLPRNSKFKITGATKSGDHTVLDAVLQ